MPLGQVALDSVSFETKLSLLGIVVQLASAVLIGALFHTLQRHARARPYVREWSAAWIALSIAIAALLVRYLGAASWAALYFEDAPRQKDWATAAFYVVYQFGKFAFFGLLLSGTVAFVRAGTPPRRPWMVVAAIAAAVATVAISFGLDDVVTWQTPFAVAALAAAGTFLLRAPRSRASFGTRGMAAVLFALVLLWIAYSGCADARTHGPLAGFFQFMRRYNSFIDLVMQTVLAVGMVITIFLDLERDAEAARDERLRMTERLAQSQRLEALGRVVSGVAHELNNPLTAILGFTEELRGFGRTGEEAEFLQIVHEQAQRCRAIVRDLLAFARSRSAERVAVDPAELIARVVRGFAPQLKAHRLELATELAPALPALSGDPSALEQVFTNLLSNAIQASPEGGRILLSARAHDGVVEFRIEDEGPGVARDLRDRVFEPFFTTKAPGSGTGLGLSVTHGIVAAHGGTIACDDRAEGSRGARFVVTLPVGADASAVLASGVTPPPASDARSGPPACVLVVDDEESVRRLLVRGFEQRGFTVVSAAGGRDALACLAANPAIDAVVTDLKMSDLSGLELIDRLATLRPDLRDRCIAITGDRESPDVTQLLERKRVAVLEKPLSVDSLVARVRKLVEKARAAAAARSS
ncbi:MAG TPA: ATP-binding protein [Planctomycetota bacterium]|nr:ATP-binding protein [Planctomycetota bacterium]